jgi:hypothetical protein
VSGPSRHDCTEDHDATDPHRPRPRAARGRRPRRGALDGLGGPGDRLWPNERWPTTPLELTQPLGVGSAGGHGSIRYTVAEHEPARRVVFAFEPGTGLEGTHRLAVEPLGDDRCRMVHTLDCRAKPWMLPALPLLVPLHDATVEDILDRAELATTGGVARPARHTALVRVFNEADARLARRRGRLAADRLPRYDASPALDRLAAAGGPAVASALAAIAAIHAAWALGWRWPGGSDEALAARVVGGEQLPPDWATWGVAATLLAAAGVVRAVDRGTTSDRVRLAGWGVAGVLALRGSALIPVDLARGFDAPYERLDLMIYSPLCLALAAGAAAVLWRSGPAVQQSREAPS